jgi:hypothetical protein
VVRRPSLKGVTSARSHAQAAVAVSRAAFGQQLTLAVIVPMHRARSGGQEAFPRSSLPPVLPRAIVAAAPPSRRSPALSFVSARARSGGRLPWPSRRGRGRSRPWRR